MLVKYLERFYGEAEPANGRRDINWEVPVLTVSLILSIFYWTFFFVAWGTHMPHLGIVAKATIGSLIGGFVLSSFTGLKRKDSRTWAMLFGTVFLPGFLVVLVFTHLIVGIASFGGVLLRVQDGLLFVQEMISGGLIKRWKARQERKRAEKDAKLKKEAEKVRVSGSGAYRSAPIECRECGQELPRMEDDGQKSRHLALR